MRRAGSRIRRGAALGFGLFALLSAASPADVDGVRHDPFAEPSPDELRRSVREPAPVESGGWTPVLRGVLVAGEESLVNLGGVVLAVGEETRGWRVIEVRTSGAVFERGTERLELGLHPGTGS